MKGTSTDFQGVPVAGPHAMNLDAALGFNAGDGTRPLDLAAFYGKYPAIKGHRDHFFKVGTANDAQRQGFHAIDRELQEQVTHKNGQSAFAQNETRVFEMVRNPKSGRDDKVYKPTTAERLEKEMRELGEQRKVVQANAAAIPQNLTAFFDNEARKRANVELIELDPNDFDNGKSIEENGDAFREQEKAFRDIVNANLTDAEVAANLDAYLAPRLRMAKDEFLSNIYALNGGLTGARLTLPAIQHLVHGAPGYVLPEDFFVLSLLKDDSLLNWIKGECAKANAGKRQIALADRPDLLRVQGAKFMVVRRHLEFSCRAEEAASGKTRRPRNTPWEVLAWCEKGKPALKVVAPGATITASTSIIPGKATGGDDFEGDDE